MVLERKNLNQSLLISKYQKDFERSPRSRVFAPLAEAYRKNGMTDKALDVIKVGIRYNPDYVLGYLILALCYIDINQFNLAYTTLRPLVHNNRDNIRLLKVFAQTCEELENSDEALETYKYLLFINPKDDFIKAKVHNYENNYKNKKESTQKVQSSIKEDSEGQDLFRVDKLDAFEDWVQVDLANDERFQLPTQENITVSDANNSNEDWVALNTVDKQEKISDELRDDSSDDSSDDSDVEKFESPIITHTLVELYCQQGHIQKALEILDKILELNPNDSETLRKKEEVANLWKMMSQDSIKDKNQDSYNEDVDDVDDFSDGHDKLGQVLDEKFGAQTKNFYDIESEKQKNVASPSKKELKLLQFLSEIYKRKNEVSSSKESKI